MTNDEIISLYKQGKSLDAIAKLCGKSKKGVSGIVSKSGASCRVANKMPNATTKSRIVDYSKPPNGFISLLHAKPKQCKWPHKSSGHFCCGKVTLNGLQYCEGHMNKAYQAGTATDLTGLGDKFS